MKAIQWITITGLMALLMSCQEDESASLAKLPAQEPLMEREQAPEAQPARQMAYNGLYEQTKGEIAHSMMAVLVYESRMVFHLVRMAKKLPESEVEERQLAKFIADLLASQETEAVRAYQRALMCDKTEPKRIEMMTAQLRAYEETKAKVDELKWW